MALVSATMCPRPSALGGSRPSRASAHRAPRRRAPPSRRSVRPRLRPRSARRRPSCWRPSWRCPVRQRGARATSKALRAAARRGGAGRCGTSRARGPSRRLGRQRDRRQRRRHRRGSAAWPTRCCRGGGCGTGCTSTRGSVRCSASTSPRGRTRTVYTSYSVPPPVRGQRPGDTLAPPPLGTTAPRSNRPSSEPPCQRRLRPQGSRPRAKSPGSPRPANGLLGLVEHRSTRAFASAHRCRLAAPDGARTLQVARANTARYLRLPAHRRPLPARPSRLGVVTRARGRQPFDAVAHGSGREGGPAAI